MAGIKITDLNPFTGLPDSGDVFYVADIDADSAKKSTYTNLLTGVLRENPGLLEYNSSTGTITAVAFVGNGSGITGISAATLDAVDIDSSAGTHYLVISANQSGGDMKTSSGGFSDPLTWNPTTSTIVATNFAGDGTELDSVTALNVTNTVNAAITDATEIAGTYYPHMTTATTGNQATSVHTDVSYDQATKTATAPKLIIADLPTTQPAAIGVLWNDGGTLKLTTFIPHAHEWEQAKFNNFATGVNVESNVGSATGVGFSAAIDENNTTFAHSSRNSGGRVEIYDLTAGTTTTSHRQTITNTIALPDIGANSTDDNYGSGIVFNTDATVMASAGIFHRRGTGRYQGAIGVMQRDSSRADFTHFQTLVAGPADPSNDRIFGDVIRMTPDGLLIAGTRRKSETNTAHGSLYLFERDSVGAQFTLHPDFPYDNTKKTSFAFGLTSDTIVIPRVDLNWITLKNDGTNWTKTDSVSVARSDGSIAPWNAEWADISPDGNWILVGGQNSPLGYSIGEGGQTGIRGEGLTARLTSSDPNINGADVPWIGLKVASGTRSGTTISTTEDVRFDLLINPGETIQINQFNYTVAEVFGPKSFSTTVAATIIGTSWTNVSFGSQSYGEIAVYKNSSGTPVIHQFIYPPRAKDSRLVSGGAERQPIAWCNQGHAFVCGTNPTSSANGARTLLYELDSANGYFRSSMQGADITMGNNSQANAFISPDGATIAYEQSGYSAGNGSNGATRLLRYDVQTISTSLDSSALNTTTVNDEFGGAVGVIDTRNLPGFKLVGEKDAPGGGVVRVYSDKNQYRYSISPGEANGQFGESIATYGDYALIGADGVEVSGQVGAGSAYLYRINAYGDATLVWQYVPPTPVIGGSFGRTVDLSKDYASMTDGSGTCHVFPWSSNTATRTITGTDAADWFAHEGNYLVHGEVTHTGTQTNEGRVKVYAIDTGATVWTKLSDVPLANGKLGAVVDVNETYFMASEPNDPNTTPGKVICWDLATGTQQGTFTSSGDTGATVIRLGEPVGTRAGHALRFMTAKGSLAAVGRYRYDNSNGRVYLFDAVSGTQYTALDNPNPYTSPSTLDGSFGTAVAGSNTIVAIGAPYEKDASNTLGAAFFYKNL